MVFLGAVIKKIDFDASLNLVTPRYEFNGSPEQKVIFCSNFLKGIFLNEGVMRYMYGNTKTIRL